MCGQPEKSWAARGRHSQQPSQGQSTKVGSPAERPHDLKYPPAAISSSTHVHPHVHMHTTVHTHVCVHVCMYMLCIPCACAHRHTHAHFYMHLHTSTHMQPPAPVCTPTGTSACTHHSSSVSSLRRITSCQALVSRNSQKQGLQGEVLPPWRHHQWDQQAQGWPRRLCPCSRV